MRNPVSAPIHSLPGLRLFFTVVGPHHGGRRDRSYTCPHLYQPRRYTDILPTSAALSLCVLLTICYLIDPSSRCGSEQYIWKDILTAFAQCADIDFVYPPTRKERKLCEDIL